MLLADANDLFDRLVPEALQRSPEKACEIDTIFSFKIDGVDDWTIDCLRSSCRPSCTRGASPQARCTVELASSDFQAMLTDPNVGMQLYFQKKLRITGDTAQVLKIAALFELVRSADRL